MMIRLISAILLWILVQALRRSKYVWITGAIGLRFAAFLIIKPLEESLIHNFLAVSLYALAAFGSYYIPLRIFEWFDEQLKAIDRRFYHDHELAGMSFYHNNITLACRLFCRSVMATFIPLFSLYMGSSKEYPEVLVCWVFGLWAGSFVLISYGTMTEDDYGVAAALIGVVLHKLNLGSNFLNVRVAVLLLIAQASRIIIIPIIIKFNIWYGDPPCPRVWDPELPISNPSSSLATFHKTCTTNSSNVAPPPRDQTNHESPPSTTLEAPQSPNPHSSPPADQTHESPPATTSEAPQSPTPQSSPPATTSEAPQSPTPQSSPPADQTVV